ncbi:MAG: hypothetical protein K5984_01385 [Bacteroidales bacterium]|nr:hypothetical protein [Bacteroidales bacterium]
MNKKITIIGTAALAVLVSCSEKEFTPASEASKVNISVSADPLTKSSFDAGNFVVWENSDVFDIHNVTLANSVESVSTTSMNASSLSDNSTVASFNNLSVNDYFCVTYPSGAVTLLNHIQSYWNSSLKDSVKFNSKKYIYTKVNVPYIQTLSSTITPEAVPMMSARYAYSSAAKTADTENAIAYNSSETITMMPLSGIGKITLKNIPDITSGTISKVILNADFVSVTSESLSANGSSEYGLVGDTYYSYIASSDSFAVAYPHNSATPQRTQLVLKNGTIDYTAADGATFYFGANHSIQPIKTLLVKVLFTDGSSVKKSFDVSGKKIYFSKEHIVSFTLDFTSGATSKLASTRFSVEWSDGYITYDSANEAYKFTSASESPLYFPFGSAIGIRLYSDFDDYESRLKPGTVTADGQTIANGSCYFYSTSPYTPAEWITRSYYYPSGTKIAAGTLSTADQYRQLQGSSAFSGETDPCSYVPVNSGENAWRMPTAADVDDLVNVSASNVEFGNVDETAPSGSDGKAKYLDVTDGEQNLRFIAYGCTATSCSASYIQYSMMYSNKYAVRFWTTTFKEATSSGLKRNVGSHFNVSLSSSVSATTSFSSSLSTAAAGYEYGKVSETSSVYYQDTDQYPMWVNVPVRCVRDK